MEVVWCVLPRAAVTSGARGFTRHHWQCPATAGPWTLSPLSTGGDLQIKIKSQKPVDFSCFSLFSDMLFSSFSSLPDLELSFVACAANKPDMRKLDRQPSSSSFISALAVSSTAAIVGRSVRCGGVCWWRRRQQNKLERRPPFGSPVLDVAIWERTG